jgi:8-oxo-dGTP diphosphatase
VKTETSLPGAERTLPVTCAIILHQNKILIAQRSEEMNMPLKWEFPGGKVEPGETEEACLKRELKEELNIEVSVVARLKDCVHHYPGFTITLLPFVVNYLAGDIILHEHKDYRWVTREELLSVDWAEADISVVHAFLDSVPGIP